MASHENGWNAGVALVCKAYTVHIMAKVKILHSPPTCGCARAGDDCLDSSRRCLSFYASEVCIPDSAAVVVGEVFGGYALHPQP